MKLYYAPGACSIGIHVLLEEIGKPYEAVALNFRDAEQYKPGFTAINPKSKVPTLVRDDGSVLTEYPAIAYWLARTNPTAGLLPDDVDQQARVLELTDYAVATIHMQGFGRLFRPAAFTPNAADEETVKTRGKEVWLARSTQWVSSRSPIPRSSMSRSGRSGSVSRCPMPSPRISSG
jgi:glutathione S-transferase